MKIGLDARALNLGSGGSFVYAERLINFLPRNTIFLFGINKYNGIKCFPSKIKPNSILRIFYENFTIPNLMKKNNISLFHGLKGVAPLSNKIKKIITVHDIATFIYPEKFNLKDFLYWKYIVRFYLKRATKIIASSENTGKDITKYLKISESKIKVIHLAADKNYKPLSKQIIEKANKKYNLNFPYILYVGTLEPRKNIPNLLRAYDKIRKKLPHKLVITGKKGWKYKEIFETIDKLNLQEDVIFTGYVDEADLPALYNGADLFVYPSFYEGFGLPPLEAMQCGCPVITSNTSSLPEVVGDAGIMINPNNINELTKAMQRVLTNENLRKDLIRKGLAQTKKFSWKKTAKETLKVYKEVMKDE